MLIKNLVDNYRGFQLQVTIPDLSAVDDSPTNQPQPSSSCLLQLLLIFWWMYHLAYPSEQMDIIIDRIVNELTTYVTVTESWLILDQSENSECDVGFFFFFFFFFSLFTNTTLWTLRIDPHLSPGIWWLPEGMLSIVGNGHGKANSVQ